MGNSNDTVTIVQQKWLHAVGESPEAYSAFCIYRDMGSTRTIADVSRHKDIKVTPETLYRWKVSHNWEDRALAFDEHYGELLFRDRVEKQRMLLNSEYAAFEKMHEYWQRCWNNFTGEESDESVPKMSMQKLLSTADNIFKLGRRSLGMPEKITKEMVDARASNSSMSADDMRQAEMELGEWNVKRAIIDGTVGSVSDED